MPRATRPTSAVLASLVLCSLLAACQGAGSAEEATTYVTLERQQPGEPTGPGGPSGPGLPPGSGEPTGSDAVPPTSWNAPVVRTDFSDEAAWNAVVAAILLPQGDASRGEEFYASVDFVDDRTLDGAGTDELVTLVGAGSEHPFFVVFDAATVTSSEHTVLVVDLLHEPGRTFRALPTAVQAIENNLSIANMDFFEFADSVDPDGVFRSFG